METKQHSTGPRRTRDRILEVSLRLFNELGEPNTRGLRHFAFRVSDLDEIVAVLEKEGVELLGEMQKVPTTQVSYGGVQKRIVYCRDPEGNLLEWCDYK